MLENADRLFLNLFHEVSTLSASICTCLSVEVYLRLIFNAGTENRLKEKCWRGWKILFQKVFLIQCGPLGHWVPNRKRTDSFGEPWNGNLACTSSAMHDANVNRDERKKSFWLTWSLCSVINLLRLESKMVSGFCKPSWQPFTHLQAEQYNLGARDGGDRALLVLSCLDSLWCVTNIVSFVDGCPVENASQRALRRFTS